MSVDTLFQQLKHKNPNLRERAICQIADLDDATIIPRLMENLGEDDVVYRRASVKALGAIGQPAIAPLIDGLTNGKNATVQASCAKALAQIATWHPDEPFPQPVLDSLKKAMSDPSPVVQLTSVMALGQVGTPALEILIDTLQSTANIALAVSIANTLGSIANPRTSEVLTELAHNEAIDPYLREIATSALSRTNMAEGKFSS
ncbi:HEAT domain containing protein [Rubidibacter lacunae KORDI 51-2]|uniref:HEAT domain containing protein n=1 Tax=Rubidibacter lacunae KORDI 51-2 TaxID=582515 RepID=U5DMW6_9CHRO|nr:HEAT repeat domain-containing protein [Rubidibacter lacunae]ERN41959.1 HEAT domain containing protein [Rubidibacter lacunae KORDI 51-2]